MTSEDTSTRKTYTVTVTRATRASAVLVSNNGQSDDGTGLVGLTAGVFPGLAALRVLVLEGNALDGLGLSDNVFEPLTDLSTLWLRHNPGAPFVPTAVALPDDGRVPVAGGAVTLNGSTSGGAWGTNVTYAWALTTPRAG